MMKRKGITKVNLLASLIVLILGTLIVLAVVINTKDKPALYILPVQLHVQLPSELLEYWAARDYLEGKLEELQEIRLWRVPQDEQKIARSDKTLDGHSFIILIDEIVKNRYISYQRMNSSIKVTERRIIEDGQNIIITDKGKMVTHSDVGFLSRTKKIVLIYRYNKQTGDIYFTAKLR